MFGNYLCTWPIYLPITVPMYDNYQLYDASSYVTVMSSISGNQAEMKNQKSLVGV